MDTLVWKRSIISWRYSRSRSTVCTSWPKPWRSFAHAPLVYREQALDACGLQQTGVGLVRLRCARHRDVVVIGVKVQLRHRGPGVAVHDVGGAHVEQLRKHGHAALIGSVEVDPYQAFGRGDRLSDVIRPDF